MMHYKFYVKNKRCLFIILASVFLFSCKSSKHASKTEKNTSTTKTESKISVPNKKEEKVDVVLKEAFSYMGTPYKYGACNRDGTDCSGLIMNSFKKIGFDLPRSSKEQGAFAKTISINDTRKGDLVFFCTKSVNCVEINHVGIVTKLDSGTVYFIHATVQKGVMINNLSENYYKKAFIKAGRVLN